MIARPGKRSAPSGPHRPLRRTGPPHLGPSPPSEVWASARRWVAGPDEDGWLDLLSQAQAHLRWFGPSFVGGLLTSDQAHLRWFDPRLVAGPRPTRGRSRGWEPDLRSGSDPRPGPAWACRPRVDSSASPARGGSSACQRQASDVGLATFGRSWWIQACYAGLDG